MTDLALSVVAAVLLVGAALAVLGLVTLAPFVAAVGLAERRGCGTARWGAASLAASGVGLGCAAVALRGGLGPTPVALGALATWAAPLALVLLGVSGGRLSGVRGRHE